MSEAESKVLVVEDNHPVQEAIRALLEGEGFYVLTAPTGAEALDILRQHKDIAAVTTSTLQWQLVNGYVLLREIKKRHPRVKVVLVTGADRYAVEAKTRGMQFDGVVYKPFLDVLPPLLTLLMDRRVGAM